MNANELADELERLYQQDIIDGVADLSMPESATMLRQQQAEILAGKIMIKGYSKTIDEQQAEIEALKEVLKEVVRISDRKHNAWDKAKELLK